jgi:ATP-dependent helicase HrpA
VDELFATVSLIDRILAASREVERAVREQNSLTLLGTLNDIKGQVAGLIHPGFVAPHRHRPPHTPSRGTFAAAARAG